MSRFLYASDVVSSPRPTIAAFAIDAKSGTLTAIGTPVAVGLPAQLAVHPNGHFLYVAAPAGGTTTQGEIDVLAIDPKAGTLTTSQTLLLGSPRVKFLAIHPAGKLAYAIDTTNGNTLGFSVDTTTGNLALLPGSPFLTTFATAQYAPTGDIEINAAGTRAFLPLTSGQVLTVSIDTTTGSLAQVGLLQQAASGYAGSAQPGTFNPTGAISQIGSDPGDRFAFGLTPVLGAPSELSVYTVDPVQGLQFTGPTHIVTTGTATNDASMIAVHPSARFVFSCELGSQGAVRQFSVDQTTGFLTTGASVVVPSGWGANALSIEQSGAFAYASSEGATLSDANVTVIAIDPTTGAPTFVATTQTPGATCIAIAP